MLQEIYDSLEPDAADAEVESFVAPTSFAQRRFWLLDALSPGRATYNVPLGVRLHGPVRPATLAAALAEVVARHETLRTAFAEEGGEPVQVIAPALAVPLPQVDLAALPAGLREDELRRQVWREAELPFDLRRAPLLRALLFRLGAGEHALFLNQHHIVTDAWSLGLLLGELMAIDGALRAGLPLALPEPPIQYADFAAWQREQLQGAALERKLAPWRRRLAGAPVELPLAPDHRGGRRTAPAGSCRWRCRRRWWSGSPPSPARGAPRCSWPSSPPFRPSSSATAAAPTSWWARRWPAGGGWRPRGCSAASSTPWRCGCGWTGR